MASHSLKKGWIWGMLIAIGMVIAVVGSTLGSSALVATAATQPTYTVKDLGTLGGFFSIGTGINNVGQVVGGAYISSNDDHAFLWKKGKKIDLGTLGGKTSRAFAINDAGQVVGVATISSGKGHAFLWEKGKKIDLGTLGGTFSEASAINKTGQVVGIASISSDSNIYHAVLWEKGKKKDFGAFDGQNSAASAINKTGQVVGSSTTSTSGLYTKAVLWDKGSIKNLNNLIPPTSGWLLDSALDINDKGQIVGLGKINGKFRAFLLTPVK